MTERPLIFSAPMVRSVEREGDPKTHTRRVAKARRKRSLLAMEEGAPVWTDGYILDPGNREWLMEEAPCRPGDVLWTRENFRLDVAYDHLKPSEAPKEAAVFYEAGGQKGIGIPGQLHPSIHQPRWATRRLLTCLDVRLERLNDCSDADALAEGITRKEIIVDTACFGGPHVEITGEGYFFDGSDDVPFKTPVDAYAALWDRINGPGAWATNPLVWVIVFEKQKALS